MAEEQVLEKEPEAPAGDVEPAPKPVENPRNAILASIAKEAFKQHDAESKEGTTVPVINEEGEVTQPPAAAPSEPEASTPPEQEEPLASSPAEPSASEPAVEQPPSEPKLAPKPGEEAIDPEKDYTIVVEGQNVVVKGKAIIDAGYRTFQKETAADFRLRTASQLLEEAEKRMAGAPAPEKAAPEPKPAEGLSKEQLAEMIQFGTKEQSAQAVQVLLDRGMPQDQIMQLTSEAARFAARDEFEYQRAKAFVGREYGDLLTREPLRNLFSAEEERLRRAGDRRPYGELYKAIGEQIRKDFNLPKPTAKPATPAARVERKAKAPSVPKTATARLEEATPAKPRSASDIIAGMAASRGKNRLNQPTKE